MAFSNVWISARGRIVILPVLTILLVVALLLALLLCVFMHVWYFFAASIIPMEKISTPQNFSLNRDAIQSAVEAFKTQKVMDVVTEMSGVEPVSA